MYVKLYKHSIHGGCGNWIVRECNLFLVQHFEAPLGTRTTFIANMFTQSVQKVSKSVWPTKRNKQVTWLCSHSTWLCSLKRGGSTVPRPTWNLKPTSACRGKSSFKGPCHQVRCQVPTVFFHHSTPALFHLRGISSVEYIPRSAKVNANVPPEFAPPCEMANLMNVTLIIHCTQLCHERQFLLQEYFHYFQHAAELRDTLWHSEPGCPQNGRFRTTKRIVGVCPITSNSRQTIITICFFRIYFQTRPLLAIMIHR